MQIDKQTDEVSNNNNINNNNNDNNDNRRVITDVGCAIYSPSERQRWPCPPPIEPRPNTLCASAHTPGEKEPRGTSSHDEVFSSASPGHLGPLHQKIWHRIELLLSNTGNLF
jgi:hypothetical protein